MIVPKRQPTIVFVNRFFYPDLSATSQMLSDLAFGLAARGHRVTVVTSRLSYDAPGERLPASESVRGVEIVRLSTTGFGRAGLVGRTIDYVTFYILAVWTLLWLVRRGDMLVAKTDPPMLSMIAAPVAWLKGARQVNWLQDIFPEVAVGLGLGSSAPRRAAFALMRSLRNWTVRCADSNVVLGDVMAQRVRAMGVPEARIRIIANWADGKLVHPVEPAANALRKQWGLDGAFVVGYSGNLGRAHESATILDAARYLESHAPDLAARVAWVIVGGGAEAQRLREDAERLDVRSIQFRPYQPRDRLHESLSVPDVHLISLRPELEGLIVPSKYYGIAASGRAAIFIGAADGEIARTLLRTDTGWVVPQGDGAALAERVKTCAQDLEGTRAAGRRARAVFDDSLDLGHALASWETMISDIVRPKH